MKTRIFTALIAGGIFLLGGLSSRGADIVLSGNCSWQVSGSTINLSAGRVDNDSTGGTSGSLRIQLWATKSPYSGGTISGYVLGTRSLSPLPGGYYYQNISGSVTYYAPPGGYYYTTMTVEEYTGSGYYIRDYLTFSGTSYLGSGGGGGGGGGGGNPGDTGTVELVGAVGWSTSGSKINITAAQVSNSRSGGTSGTLRLQIWATSSAYAGGAMSGYVIGSRVLGTLPGGYVFNNIQGAVNFTPPPAGTYYTTITLEEFRNGTFIIVDYVTFSSTATFGGGIGGFGGSPGGSGAGLQILGAVKFKLSVRKGATLQIQQVLNDNAGASSVSGTLRLRLWATDAPYSGGAINGYVMASHSLGQLAAGYYYSGIKTTVSYTPPPSGRYFVVMTLEEYRNGSYYIVDSVNFSKLIKVK